MNDSLSQNEAPADSRPLAEEWERLRSDNPGIRSRKAAHELGVTELELVSALADGTTVVRLDAEPEELIHRAEEFGYCMALTRNDAVISQTEGYYRDIEFEAHAGNVLGDNVDLRLFHNSWVEAFAVSGDHSRSDHPSLQFFHQSGQATHKIYLLEDDGSSRLQGVIEDHRHARQNTEPQLEQGSGDESSAADASVDEEAFLEDWGQLQDTHDFFGLLKDYNLTRTEAFRIARGSYTEPVPVSGILELLEQASQEEIPIMVFVRNPGCIQIHSGPVENVSDNDDWYNVLDDDFDLHVNHSKLSEAWVVEKPVEVGKVTSIEAFDETGDQVVSFFGVRKSGEQEDPDWRSLTETIRGLNTNAQ